MMSRANMETFVKQMQELDPDETTWTQHGYTGAGTGSKLMVQAYDERGRVTPCMAKACANSEYMHEHYPLLDEDSYDQMEYDAITEYIREEVKTCFLRKRVPSLERIVSRVLQHLSDNGVEMDGDDLVPSDGQIYSALRDSGYLSTSMYDEDEFDPYDHQKAQRVRHERWERRWGKKHARHPLKIEDDPGWMGDPKRGAGLGRPNSLPVIGSLPNRCCI